MNPCVFVTGGVRNTGAGIVRKFAENGYDVFIGSRTAAHAEAFAAQIAEEYGVFAKGYGMISFDEENVREIFADIRKEGRLLDALVCCAADLGIAQHWSDVPMADFMRVVNTNIGWNFMLARQALQMQEKGKGSIVFINSNTAYRAIPDRVAYSASKSGVLGMARALALDLGRLGIRVNCVLPGMIERGTGHIVNIGSVAGNRAFKCGNVYGATKAFVNHFSRMLRCDLLGTPVRVTNIKPGHLHTEFLAVRFKGDLKTSEAAYENLDPLTPENIAESVWWSVNLPAHMDVCDMELMPMCQSDGGWGFCHKS